MMTVLIGIIALCIAPIPTIVIGGGFLVGGPVGAGIGVVVLIVLEAMNS